MILLDTNVISETMRERPSRAVLAWLDSQLDANLCTASVVIAELFSGIECMPVGRKQQILRKSIERAITEKFGGRVLPFNLASARQFAEIVASRRRTGRPIHEMDAEIAAIALSNRATLATRDVGDFADCQVNVVNPWEWNE
jgi:predicted nucleic acid-binding protein